MSIRIKNNLIKSIRSGNKTIKKVYSGDVLIYPDQNLSGDIVLFLEGEGITNGGTVYYADNNIFSDSSSNNFIITKNGGIAHTTFSPFSLNYTAYNPSVYGGRAYASSTSDFLQLPYDGSTQNWQNWWSETYFTMECWVNIRVFGEFALMNWSTQPGLLSNYLYINSEGRLILYTWSGSPGHATLGLTTSTVSLNTWTHIAFVKNTESDIAIYVNGVKNSLGTVWPTSIQPCSEARLFSTRGGIGYISGYRTLLGSALYTSNFTPSTTITAPPTNITGTGLLLNFTDGLIYDSTSKNHLITVGDSKTVPSNMRVGNGSIYFPTFASQLLLSPEQQSTPGSNLDYGAGNFTIECWYNLVAVSNMGAGIIISQTVSSNNNLLLAVNSSRAIGLWLGHVNLGASASGVVPLNTWCHIALVRNGNDVKIFVDGTAAHTATTTSTALGTNMVPCINGYAHDARYGNQCYMDDFKITKGAALYTSNFTP